jgi:hypothetical protein
VSDLRDPAEPEPDPEPEAEPDPGPSPSPDAAYWTERWLRVGRREADPLDGRASANRTIDRRARDRAEVAIVRTPHLPPQGPVRTQILARRASASARLGELDESLRDTFEQRRRLVDRIERCTRALRGSGHQFDERRGRYRGMRRVAWRDEQDQLVEEALGVGRAGSIGATSVASTAASSGTQPTALTGASLRRRAEELLQVLEVPVSPAELVELLALEGIAVPGRPSQTLTNALRVSLARGDVERCGRGRYRWAPSNAVT